jgi:hypothetical protein
MFRRALAGRERALGPNNIKTLKTIHNLGAVRYKQNKLVEAAALFQRAVDGFGNILGLEHEITLRSNHALGVVYAEFESDSE